MDSGIYIAVFFLPETQYISIGKLGRFYFNSGIYLYVGSAQKNLTARLRRHSRRQKLLRWHIDYLSCKAQMLGAIEIPGPRELECQTALELAECYESVLPGFGSSDCRCRGHLFYAGEKLYI